MIWYVVNVCGPCKRPLRECSRQPVEAARIKVLIESRCHAVRFQCFRCPKRRNRTPAREVTPATSAAAGRTKGKLQRQASVVVEDYEADAVDREPQTVSVTSCLFVISSFVVFGAVLFGVWEVSRRPAIDACLNKRSAMPLMSPNS